MIRVRLPAAQPSVKVKLADQPSAAVSQSPVPRVSVRLADAEIATGIGQRTLWELARRGQIPHVRVGRILLFPLKELTEWLSAKCAAQKQGNDDVIDDAPADES